MLSLLLQSQSSSAIVNTEFASVKSNHSDLSNFETNSDSESVSDSDDIPFTTLLLNIAKTEEDIFICKNGYKVTNKICNTLQGELLKAKCLKSTLRNASIGEYVAIKKTDKQLLQQRIAIENDVSFFVEENAIKEASILKQLTHNTRITKFVDYFESSEHCYLVMEYVDNAVTLNKFVDKSHRLMREGKLTLKEYARTIKSIMWQLGVTIRWLHDVVQSCHLDICMSNIMIQHWEYLDIGTGLLKSNNEILIKLGDFGLAELFDENEDEIISYECNKNRLSLTNEYLVAPQIHDNDVYDGRSADMWGMGMVFYQCMVGKTLYSPEHMWDSPQFGYFALLNNKLRQYLSTNNLLRYFKGSSFKLLKNLLMIDEKKRLDALGVVKHQWFKTS